MHLYFVVRTARYYRKLLTPFALFVYRVRVKYDFQSKQIVELQLTYPDSELHRFMIASPDSEYQVGLGGDFLFVIRCPV